MNIVERYIVVYYKNNQVVQESEPYERTSYPLWVDIANKRNGVDFDYAVIQTRYYKE